MTRIVTVTIYTFTNKINFYYDFVHTKHLILRHSTALLVSNMKSSS